MAFSFITEAFGKVKTLLLNVDENYAITTLGLTDATGTAWNPVTNANPVPISDAGGSITVDGPVTDAQLRATPVPVSGTVTATGGLTDTQLRATPVPVSGTVTATTGGLTDTQLRATAVPVSGTVTANVGTGTQPVSGTVTANLGTIAGVATEATLAARTPAALTAGGGIKVGNVDALPVGANRIGKVTLRNSADAADIDPLTDAQLRATAVPVSGTVTANVGTGTQPVSGTVTANLGTIAGAATEATLDARSGALTETAPASDTASSGLNGRLQRVAQRLTSLIALIPTALTGSGNFKSAIVESTATVTTKGSPAGTATLANVAASVTSVTLIAANANRLGATIWNDSTSILYVKFGSTASATSAVVAMAGGSYYEVPYWCTTIITGIWVSATGSARVAELTT